MKNTTNNPTRSLTKFALMTMAVFLVIATSISIAIAQDPPSTDRDKPTPLTSNIVTGDGVDEKTEYFYSFNAGPGEVTVTLDVKAEKGIAVSSVDIALFDAKSKKLMSTYANPDHGSSKRAVETVKVRGTQTLLLEVSVSPGVDNFKIKLDGAVKIDPIVVGGSPPVLDPSATPSPTPSEGGTSLDSSSANATDAAEANSSSAETAGADATSGTTATGQEAGSAQPSVASSSSKTGKVNSKINSASATLSGIITAAGSTADSVKNLKKKKQ